MSKQPLRVQLSRARGWKKPANTVNVARPTKWGNPYRVGSDGVMTAATAVQLFEKYIQGRPDLLAEARAQLRGKHLACWCPPSSACHADVLLRLINS